MIKEMLHYNKLQNSKCERTEMYNCTTINPKKGLNFLTYNFGIEAILSFYVFIIATSSHR